MNSVIALIITLGVLVTIHEWGHYIVARLCGVKVLRFSIGFGKPFFSKMAKNGTEFAIAPIPLGGYVKMLDEREGAVPESEKHLAFNNQPLWQRAAIVAAGPIINLIFSVLALWFLFAVGVSYMPAMLGEAPENTPAAQAGLPANAQITAVDGQWVRGWKDVLYQLADKAGTGKKEIIITAKDSQGLVNDYHLTSHDLLVDTDKDPLESLGLVWQELKLPARLGEIIPNSAAASAGLQAGDLIVSVNQQFISSWQQWVSMVQQSPEKTLQLSVERKTADAEETIILQLIPKKHTENGVDIGQAGVYPNAEELAKASPQQTLKLNIFEALGAGYQEAVRLTQLQINMLVKLVTGQLSTKHLGGPVSIAKMANQSAEAGWQSFLQFLAIFSIMLGVLNLLPIPVLDGGHLLFMGFEAVRGKPLSEYWQARFTAIGMMLLLAIMSFALFNDFTRL